MQIDLLIQLRKEIYPNQKISTNTGRLCFTFTLSLLTPPPFLSLKKKENVLLSCFTRSIKISLFHREAEKKGKWIQREGTRIRYGLCNLPVI